MIKAKSMYFIHPGVALGTNPSISRFVEIGLGCDDGQSTTRIGDNARIRSHSVIYDENVIGDGFSTGHFVMLREANTVGNWVSIGTQTIIEHHVTIEDEVRIHTGAFVPEYSVIKQGAWLGPSVCLTNAKYPNSPATKAHLAGVVIGKQAKIGANATVLPGVTIGSHALVAAGSVVSKDVPPFAIVRGVPAAVVGDVRELRYPGGEKIYLQAEAEIDESSI